MVKNYKSWLGERMCARAAAQWASLHSTCTINSVCVKKFRLRIIHLHADEKLEIGISGSLMTL